MMMRWRYERSEPLVCCVRFAAFHSKLHDNILLTSTNLQTSLWRQDLVLQGNHLRSFTTCILRCHPLIWFIAGGDDLLSILFVSDYMLSWSRDEERNR
jgi:hypothetical protein